MLYAFAKNKTEITNAQKQKIAEANYIYIYKRSGTHK